MKSADGMDLPESLKKYNLYHLLGVSSFSDIRTIKKGFRNLAFQYHPDTGPADQNSIEKFELGTQAYKFLLDETNRSLYNRALRSRLKKILKLKSKELVVQIKKTYKRFYTKRGLVDQDYNRFVDECRENFREFLKNGAKVKVKPKVYNEETMQGENFDDFVEDCRSDYLDYFKTIPRVKKRRT